MKSDPLHTAAFTGHRYYCGEAARELDRTVGQLAGEGIDTFLCGMAMGFDMAAAESVMRMRSLLTDKEIRLVAVVPFRGQAARFPAAERERYERILAAADEVEIVSEHYVPQCYSRRNDRLVDSSSVLVAWYDGASAGGTRYTVARARRTGRRIINLRPSEQLNFEF